ncbi:hypothetical protein E4T56_gene8387 [Termitomyces sp. T112]|nr:hypothetical protein E4T56_gene8387 [Termitomyces sp. T112]
MAATFTTVVGGFEIASAVGTYVSVGQSHLNNNQLCQITVSLSKTMANLVSALEGLNDFAERLTEDECGTFQSRCQNISEKLEKYQNRPIPKKKRFFRENQEYKLHLTAVKDLEVKSSRLLIQLKQVSSNAAIKMAQVERIKRQDHEAREARKNFLEDIKYLTTVKQLNLSGFPDLPALKLPKIILQEIPSTEESGMKESLRQDPFSDEASVAWAEHKPPQGQA